MKKRNSILICSLVIMGFALMLTISCKKKDDNNPTGQVPVLTTSAVSNIALTTATCGGNITSDGGSTVKGRGVCWSKGQTPTINDTKTIDGDGAGNFTSVITGLSLNTKYYVRAYAINSAGTGYGSALSFVTNGDNIAPAITMNGADMKITQFSTFTDPGASAIDNMDGVVNVVVSGTVNTAFAGVYVITYTATDAAGNTSSAIRTVTVSGSDFLEGSYNVEDFTGSTSNGTYLETITSSSVTSNKINFTMFAFYVNGIVYGTISGTSITIPQQTVTCGYPAADRTFSGSGSYVNNFATFTINYTETTNGTSVNGHDVYTRH